MLFETFLSKLKELKEGEERSYWHFDVKVSNVVSIYWRNRLITEVETMTEAIMVLSAMYKMYKVEFE